MRSPVAKCTKRLHLACLIACLSVAVLTVLPRLGSPSKITKANFDKLGSEMTRAEIEAILGEPTDEQVLDSAQREWTRKLRRGVVINAEEQWHHEIEKKAPAKGLSWLGDDSLIHIGFSKDGHIVSMDFFRTPHAASFFDRIRLWIKLN